MVQSLISDTYRVTKYAGFIFFPKLEKASFLAKTVSRPQRILCICSLYYTIVRKQQLELQDLVLFSFKPAVVFPLISFGIGPVYISLECKPLISEEEWHFQSSPWTIFHNLQVLGVSSSFFLLWNNPLKKYCHRQKSLTEAFLRVVLVHSRS